MADPRSPRSPIASEALVSASIYLADDEPANRLLLEQVLARGGFRQVRSFADGQQLLAACAEREPDLILLDLRMPQIDGLAVLRELGRRSRRRPDLPIIVLTADANVDSRNRALREGASDFLAKPFDFEEVVLRCRNLLETRLLYGALAERVVTLGDEVIAGQHSIRQAATERALVAASLERVSGLDDPHAIAACVVCGPGRSDRRGARDAPPL